MIYDILPIDKRLRYESFTRSKDAPDYLNKDLFDSRLASK